MVISIIDLRNEKVHAVGEINDRLEEPEWYRIVGNADVEISTDRVEWVRPVNAESVNRFIGEKGVKYVYLRTPERRPILPTLDLFDSSKKKSSIDSKKLRDDKIVRVVYKPSVPGRDDDWKISTGIRSDAPLSELRKSLGVFDAKGYYFLRRRADGEITITSNEDATAKACDTIEWTNGGKGKIEDVTLDKLLPPWSESTRVTVAGKADKGWSWALFPLFLLPALSWQTTLIARLICVAIIATKFDLAEMYAFLRANFEKGYALVESAFPDPVRDIDEAVGKGRFPRDRIEREFEACGRSIPKTVAYFCSLGEDEKL